MLHRHKYILLYSLGWLFLLLVHISIIGMFLIAMFSNSDPGKDIFKKWKEYCEKKIMPLLRIQTDGSYYVLQLKFFFRWRTSPRRAHSSDWYDSRADVIKDYRKVKEYYQERLKKWNTLVIPDETELGKTLQGK
jgi:hypothetical protein